MEMVFNNFWNPTLHLRYSVKVLMYCMLMHAWIQLCWVSKLSAIIMIAACPKSGWHLVRLSQCRCMLSNGCAYLCPTSHYFGCSAEAIKWLRRQVAAEAGVKAVCWAVFFAPIHSGLGYDFNGFPHATLPPENTLFYWVNLLSSIPFSHLILFLVLSLSSSLGLYPFCSKWFARGL